MSILKVFISQLLEFLNDLILLFPNDINLKTSKKAVLTLQKINPDYGFYANLKGIRLVVINYVSPR